MRLLFIGGCKSGKSSTAQRMARALACGKPMYYWATMEPHDGEDLARIRKDSFYWYQKVIQTNGECL